MALHSLLKLSNLSVDHHLFKVVQLNLFIRTTATLNLRLRSVQVSQDRYYRKFSRIPIEVRPAKQDEKKVLLTDYVDETSKTVNEEVLKEAEMLSRLTQTTATSFSTSKRFEEGFDGSTLKVQESNDKMYLKVKESDKQKKSNFDRAKSDAKTHPISDPVIRKAVTSIKLELFKGAHGIFRVLLSKSSSSKGREETDTVMLEGTRLLREATSSGLVPVVVYTSRGKLLLDMMPKDMPLHEKVDRLKSYKIYRTSYKLLNTWSSVVKSQGIIGVFKLSDAASAPRLQILEACNPAMAGQPPPCQVTVVLDEVREPGNMGAIIRTLAAVGGRDLVLMKGCCDPWDGKALRAACGGHFNVKITRDVTWDQIYNAVPSCPDVYIADVCNTDREPLRDIEGEEMDDDDDEEELVELRSEKVRKEERRVMKRRNLPEDSDWEEEDDDDDDEKEGISASVGGDGKRYLFDNSFNDEQHLSKFANAVLPTKYFNEINFFANALGTTDNAVLVLGSETGLSNSAKKFASDNYGLQVSIPLQHGVDSLNTSVASGVILYEMWNQTQKMQARMARQQTERSDKNG